MQKKTIKKSVEKKLNAWLETITVVELRKDVKKNLLLSGGSIASMFLNEKINDYDIYLQDRNVLRRLIMYYTIDIKDRIEIITKGCIYPPFDNNAYTIAIDTLKENQVKIFFKDDADKGGIKMDVEKFREDKLPFEEGKTKKAYQLGFVSPNAISLTDDIQIVTRFTGNPEEIHKTFDFIHATNYFTFADGLVTNLKAVESLLTKQLRYQGSMYPLTSIIRFKKFIMRGWKISAGEILKILFQVSDFDLKDPNVLEDQLIGVDVAYFSLLIEALRGAKAEITSTYINKLIDKIFNDESFNDA